MSKRGKPSPLGFSVVGIIGSFAIILLILWTAYLPQRPAKINQSIAAERRRKLVELEARQHETTTNYGWVNANQGIVRIPVERAIELVVQELGAAHSGGPTRDVPQKPQ